MFTRKEWLVIAIIASWLPTFILLDYSVLSQPLGILSLVARFCAITGTIILFWEYILSVRPISGKLVKDISWTINLHKNFGIYGLIFVLLHPILITIYFLNTLGVNLLHFDIVKLRDLYKDFGVLAFCLLVVIWLTSALLRSKMSFHLWEKLHFLTYIIFPLVLLHNIGLVKAVVPISGNVYWYSMAVIYVFVLIYQILGALGITEVKYKVTEVKHETNKVITVVLTPIKKFIQPKPGQFIYVQHPGHPEAHPFGVSGMDNKTHRIAFTAKDLGRFSAQLQNVTVGEELIIEGPYGEFGKEIYTTQRDVVLIAGGIGITPFMPTVQELAGGWGKNVTLFYGNQTEADIAFLAELAETESVNSNFKVVHVITNPTKTAQESGFITCEVLQRHLNQDLENYDFFVCGPPVMVQKLVPELKEFEVPKNQIHFELFSW